MRPHVIIDLGYGDCGKGTTVDAMVRELDADIPVEVVRFNGAGQAGHNVVTPDGRHHTFSQWGSGTLAGARTILSRYMIINPLAAFVEAEHLVAMGILSPFACLTVDGMCLVTTPYHQALNRIKELQRGDARHGSCGIGVGETVRCANFEGDNYKADAIRAFDLADTIGLTAKLERLRQRLSVDAHHLIRDMDQSEERLASELQMFLPEHVPTIARRFLRYAQLVEIRDVHSVQGNVVFEGAQGVLLDEWYGFDPYTTWSTCTSENARVLAKEWGLEEPHVMGVLRAYAVRHGPGPMVSEDVGLTHRIQDIHNVTHPWQGAVRIGWFDVVASRYAIEVDGHVDSLAITCLDRLASVTDWKACVGYQNAAWPPGMGTRLEVMGRDLNFQRELTQQLMTCTPVLEVTASGGSFQERMQKHLEFIEDSVNTPVAVMSVGWTSQDKKWLPGYDVRA